MSFAITIHYDNFQGFANPHLWVWYAGSSAPDDFAATGKDSFGVVFSVTVKRLEFQFKFKEGAGPAGPWEKYAQDRVFRPLKGAPGVTLLNEIWCHGETAFVYPVLPRSPEVMSAQAYVATLTPKPGLYLPATGGLSGLGATVLNGTGVLFGLYHPNAARVYVFGSFNGFQRPGHPAEDPARFCELKRYRGYFGIANLWLAEVPGAAAGDEYKFCIQGGVPSDDKGRFQRYTPDPYARQLGPDFGLNNSVVVDPTTFAWTDQNWRTPDISSLIFYELSVYGFTEGDPGIANPGTFGGVTERIRMGYFNDLGVTALSLMPLSEFPGLQGPGALGYAPSLYCTVERDFGTPDDLRQLVNEAHARGLAVLLDQVFNHTSNDFNPLWQLILEHPGEEFDRTEGGLYFNGSTPWGNRLATEKRDVQYMLIDACKLLLVEYHVDGFRFDATHTNYMDHGFLHHLYDELKAFKPSVLLVVENLPNQSDLNRQGFNGFAQWGDVFHDKMKALLREGTFDNGQHYSTDHLGGIFYFSKDFFAAHTNNVVNYVESHDETSIPYEAKTNPILNNPGAKERKGRLGFFAALVALGQPMIYMGQEFNVERDRNFVSFEWPGKDPSVNGFYRWASRLIKIRRRYPALKMAGYDPAADGRFTWIVALWLEARHGGGRKVLGWLARPDGNAHEQMMVLLNFEGFPVTVDLELGLAGTWIKLADVENANDLPPFGTNAPGDATALVSQDGRYANFVLPSSSGFVYKWEQ